MGVVGEISIEPTTWLNGVLMRFNKHS